MKTIQDVCHKYGVDFKITYKGDTAYFHFGEVVWGVPAPDKFVYLYLFEVVQILSAKNPSKILSQYE